MRTYLARRLRDANRCAIGERATRRLRALGEPDGQVLVLVPLVFVPLFVLMAIAVMDVGAMLSIRRDNQSTADLTALAAVVELPNAAQAEAIALQWLERNGFNSLDYEITFPAADEVRVSVTREHQALFGQFIGRSSWDVSAAATARLERSPLPFALITLNETGCARLTVEGSAKVNVTGGGGTYTRSNCATNALDVSGHLTTGLNEVVGGTHTGGSAVLTPQPSQGLWRDDPFRDLEMDPAIHRPATCSAGPYTINGGAATISPGRYCQRLSVSGNAIVIVQPGIYWLERGMVVDSNNATFRTALPTDEVLFYSTCPVSPCDGTALLNADPTIRFAGAATTSLKGHSDFANVLFWVDRTAASGCTLQFEGQSGSGLAGSAYALPCHTRIAGGGGANLSLSMSFVTGSFTAAGNAAFTIPYNAATAPSEIYPALIQ